MKLRRSACAEAGLATAFQATWRSGVFVSHHAVRDAVCIRFLKSRESQGCYQARTGAVAGDGRKV
ncbi:hypothetical protein [Acetobacter sicerae]|uniref:hypothetical protein n=1 Tax=Acetobacter sicerae TaxID=85325 RepID=UPI00156AC094|nr:hypothetical protein [Acetobacter sicerae]